MTDPLRPGRLHRWISGSRSGLSASPSCRSVRSYGARLKPEAVAAHLRLADLYRGQGNERKAAEQCQAAGFVAGGAWMILGPFDNADGSALDTAYPPEQEVDFARECPGKTGTIRWFRYAGRRTDGFVDLASALKPNEWTVAYAATQVDSPEARDVQLRIGTDDEAKVWLNGNLVLNSRAPRFAGIVRHRVGTSAGRQKRDPGEELQSHGILGLLPARDGCSREALHRSVFFLRGPMRVKCQATRPPGPWRVVLRTANRRGPGSRAPGPRIISSIERTGAVLRRQCGITSPGGRSRCRR
jgi:hypothetical protein